MILDILTISNYYDGIPRATERVLSFVAEAFNAKPTFSHISLSEARRGIPLTKLPDDCVGKAKAAQAVLYLSSTDVDNALGINSDQILGNLGKSLNLCAKVRKAHVCGGERMVVCEAFRGFRPDENGFRVNANYGREAYTTECYGELEIERVARIAYELATNSRQKITLVDTGSRFAVSSLWRKIVTDINEDYPYVNVDFLSPEQGAKRLASTPDCFDVILCPSAISESLGGILSAISGEPVTEEYLGETTPGISACLAETRPSDAAAESEYALSTLSVIADMLEFSFGLPAAAEYIKNAVSKIKRRGNNPDIQPDALADEIIFQIRSSIKM